MQYGRVPSTNQSTRRQDFDRIIQNPETRNGNNNRERADFHIFFLAASIIKLFIILFLLILNSKAEDNNIKQFSKDEGVLSIMYHRFDENKYPSTNIRMDIFKKHIQLIKELNYDFIHPKDFEKNFDTPKKQKKILLTIDDAFKSFYENAWPYLKKNKIPFILFVSTEPVGNNGYMTWDQIKEIDKRKLRRVSRW